MIKLTYPECWQSSTSLISLILLPLSWLYYLATKLKLLFNSSPLQFCCKTIAIGNINIGGTGKTQLALYLAQYYQSQGTKICILTKGYGRTTHDTRFVIPHIDKFDQVGDEALMLAHYCPVIIYKNIAAANILVRDNSFELVIFDDALQNHQFIKDTTILMIDGLRGFGNGRLLPAGPLREYPTSIKQNYITVIVGSDLFNVAEQLSKLSTQPNMPIQASIKVINNIDTDTRYYAFAGIGNPHKFYDSLHKLKLNIIATQDFADHYNYRHIDLQNLKTAAEQLSCRLITTEKDWIKLPTNYQSTVDCLKISLELDCQKLISLINAKIH